MQRIPTYQELKAQEAAGKVLLDFFIYRAQAAALGAGASQAVTVNIQADSAFILDKMSVFADLAGAAQTDSTRVIPLVTLQITDGGSGRNLQNGPIPLSSIAGNGELPFVLPQPRVFVANSSITFTFTNFSLATTYTNVFLSLIGRKVFTF